MDRPITTLFLLMSVDGKISTGDTDALDFDRDLPHIPGVREGLQQYYDIEQTTDLWSLNSGRVQAKVGVNDREPPAKTPVSFVVLDNTHLTAGGVRHLCAKGKRLVLVTSNSHHPAFRLREENLDILFRERPALAPMLETLKTRYDCERLTIQTGGTLNQVFLREKLLDYVDIVVAPLLVGGRDTPTPMDGGSIPGPDRLGDLGVLELESATPLTGSYLRLRYKVIS